LLVSGALEAIFWDNDGILVNTEHLYFEATRHVLASAGIPLTEHEYVELFLVQGKGAWHLAEKRGVPPHDIDRLRDERNALYSAWLAQSPRLMPGITDVLEALHGKYVMGVVTSSRKDHFDVIHRGTGLLKYFDFILTASDYARVKPDPEPYRRAVERSGCRPEACVAIEDSERGLEAARGAGISCIVVPGRLTRGRRFAGARRVLASVSEIPTTLAAAM
jgi:HAD superfamily hydrolase (TIGR01509 family)